MLARLRRKWRGNFGEPTQGGARGLALPWAILFHPFGVLFWPAAAPLPYGFFFADETRIEGLTLSFCRTRRAGVRQKAMVNKRQMGPGWFFRMRKRRCAELLNGARLCRRLPQQFECAAAGSAARNTAAVRGRRTRRAEMSEFVTYRAPLAPLSGTDGASTPSRP